MITPEFRVEHLGRAMCRAAGFVLDMVLAPRSRLLAAASRCTFSQDLTETEHPPPAF